MSIAAVSAGVIVNGEVSGLNISSKDVAFFSDLYFSMVVVNFLSVTGELLSVSGSSSSILKVSLYFLVQKFSRLKVSL